MTVTFDLPDQLEKSLRERYGDVGQAAKEAALLEIFRREELSAAELGGALGLDRARTRALLKERGIYEQSLTASDLEEDYRTLEHVLGPIR